MQKIWDEFYSRTNFDDVFWMNNELDKGGNWCLNLEEQTHAGFVDLGGGLSPLTKAMVDNHASHATLLDISKTAIDKQKDNLKDFAASEHIEFVQSDVLDWEPERGYGLAHDRGLFQWFTDKDEKDRYKARLKEILVEDGRFILSLFTPRAESEMIGPAMAKSDPLDAVEFFDDAFRLVSMSRHRVKTENGGREFTYHYHFALRPPP